MTPTKKTTTRKPSVRVKLPPNPFVHEILELVDSQRTKAKKIEILREYDDLALKAILIWNFDPTAISVLPEGPVPYKENEVPIGTDLQLGVSSNSGLYRNNSGAVYPYNIGLSKNCFIFFVCCYNFFWQLYIRYKNGFLN